MKRLILAFSILLLSLAIVGGTVGFLIYNSQNIQAHRLETFHNKIEIFDDNDEPIVDKSKHRINIETLPDHIKWAFICVEDKDYYDHSGLSYGRIVKATYKNLNARRTKEGASTISQQLIKNTHLSPEKTLNRKVREAALALKLEQSYTKDQILQMYLEVVYFGNGINGLQDAARFYFDKPAEELSIRQAASLAGLLRSPARFDPIRNPQNFYDRTNLVIHMMFKQERITKEQYQTARLEEITIHGKRPICDSRAYRNAVVSQSIGITGLTQEMLEKKGFKIYTFFDRAAQAAVDTAVRQPEYQIKTIKDTAADSLVISADQHGRINAIHTSNRLMPTAKRNFASTLKPLVVYAPAIELGIVTPETVISDQPYASGDFHPRNHDGKFRGDVTVRESLAHSYNVPTVKVLDYTTVKRACEVAKGLGLPLGDETLALGLGVANGGITAIEVFGGFCTLANGGFKTSPSFIKRIENSHGNVVWEFAEPEQRVLKNETCSSVTEMLCLAVKSGTARKLSSLDFDVAAKTGTAERQGNAGNTDAAIVCYTPEHVLLVWNGNASMRPGNDLPSGTTGGGKTAFIARDILKSINKNSTAFEEVSACLGALTEPPKKQLGRINLKGRTSETGAPSLDFNTTSKEKYQVHRRVDGTQSLMQVINGKDDRHTFIDVTAPQSKIIEYWVTSGDRTSDIIKIYTASPINKDAKASSRPSTSRHWFF